MWQGNMQIGVQIDNWENISKTKVRNAIANNSKKNLISLNNSGAKKTQTYLIHQINVLLVNYELLEKYCMIFYSLHELLFMDPFVYG